MNKRKTEKLLPLNTINPNYFFSPPTAYLLNILDVYSAYNPDIFLWIINNFISLYIDIDIGSLSAPDKYFDYQDFFRQDLWYNCPFVESINIKQDFIQAITPKKFSNLVTTAIDLNYYVYTVLNKRYIPNYNSTQDSLHNLLIYGYNSNDNTFNIADYFRDGVFTYEICHSKHLDLAYSKLDAFSSDIFNCINLLHYRPCDTYQFSVCNIKNSLVDYLNSTDLIQKHHHAFFAYEYRNSGLLYCGISYYDAIIEIIKREQSLSPKTIHLLVAQKSIMNLRLQKLLELDIIRTSNLIKSNLSLLEEIILLRNYILRINIRTKSRVIKNTNEKNIIIEKIHALKEKDSLLTQQLINEL